MPKDHGPLEVLREQADVVVILDCRIELPVSIDRCTKALETIYKPSETNSNVNNERSHSIAAQPIFD